MPSPAILLHADGLPIPQRLPLASLGEMMGYRRVYLTGLALFTLASAFCALSHTLLLLDA